MDFYSAALLRLMGVLMIFGSGITLRELFLRRHSIAPLARLFCTPGMLCLAVQGFCYALLYQNLIVRHSLLLLMAVFVSSAWHVILRARKQEKRG